MFDVRTDAQVLALLILFFMSCEYNYTHIELDVIDMSQILISLKSFEDIRLYNFVSFNWL